MTWTSEASAKSCVFYFLILSSSDKEVLVCGFLKMIDCIEGSMCKLPHC